MKLHLLCAALLAASSAFAQTNNPPAGSPAPSVTPSVTPSDRSVDPRGNARIETPASTGTTGPRPAERESSSAGTTAIEGSASAGATRSTGRCDTLLDEERAKCLKEQAATGTVK